ncbi:MAG: mechanosensitive ion channel family protein [Actinomycetota bacterium]
MALLPLRRNLLAWMVATLLTVIAMPPILSQPAIGQLPETVPLLISNATEPDHKLDGIPVKLDDQLLFLVYEGVGRFSTRERVDTITHRIEAAAADPSIPVTVTLEDQPDSTNVMMGGKTLVTVREVDAKQTGINRKVLAQDYRDRIQKAIQRYRTDRQPQIILRGVGISLVATIALMLTCGLLNKLCPHHIRENVRLTGHIPAIRLLGIELFPASNVTQVLASVCGFLRIILLLAVFILYLSILLSQFVWTRELGTTLWSYLTATLQTTLTAVAAYLPNLINIALILLAVSYVLKFVDYFFGRIQAGAIVIPGFYPDWIAPTNRLVSILIMGLASMIAVPYLPGYGSPAFQGVSIFFGVLLSLGATGTVTNVVAGVVLIYARSFQVGDRIKVADITGDVVDKSLLVTRIRTVKNELITLPNSLILNSYTINYSRLTRTGEGALILYTSVTLGYDVPWRDIHIALIDAALATEYILQVPQPFVLQTSLNDYHITYQLNAYTDHPEVMAEIYSKLHQNIQDKCNSAGIEILSPGYAAIRDGNYSTIPEAYLPNDYMPPSFSVSNSHQNFQKKP